MTDNSKIKNALAKIKEKKAEKTETPIPSEQPEEENQEGEQSVIEILQNAGIYRREVLIRLSTLIDLQEENNKNIKEFIELLQK